MLPIYLDLMRDVKAIAAAGHINILYGLQPEIILEQPADLTENERRFSKFAFHHHGDVGTLGWRSVSPKLPRF